MKCSAKTTPGRSPSQIQDCGSWANRVPWVPLLLLAAFGAAGLVGPWLYSQSPYETSLPEGLKPPGWTSPSGTLHLLGTDQVGRDLLSRLLLGARLSLALAVVALAAGAGVGLILGVAAGYLRGWADIVIGRAIDATLSFPAILFALVLAVSLGPGFKTVVIAIVLVLWARFAGVIRGEVLALRERDFIAQAKADGCSTVRIMVVHILPNIGSTLMVLMSLNVGYVILTEATLSFLGAGIPPPETSWGQIAGLGRDYLRSAWWISIFPGIAIGLVVLAFNLLGDWLRDALDPKLRAL